MAASFRLTTSRCFSIARYVRTSISSSRATSISSVKKWNSPNVFSMAAIGRRSAFTHGSITAASEADPSTTPISRNSKATAVDTQFFVVSVTGPDRVGVVHDFSRALKNIYANVESSRMACLGGDFAMIVMISLQKKDSKAIQTCLESALPGFQIHTRPASTVVERHVSPDTKEYELYVEGPDSEGIVEAVTSVLARKGANIVELETETVSAPFAGFVLFRMGSRVAFPSPLYHDLVNSLTKVEEDFGVDIDLEEVVDEEEYSDDDDNDGRSNRK
eukprot:jgi/Galph1/1167/GphlegSOOS_G5887.1